MNRKRILALGKLGLLFGGPVALVLGLFSCGVYCGYDHRTGIATFERDWLGMDVEVPKSDDKDDDKDKDDKDKDDKDKDDKDKDDKDKDDKDRDDKDDKDRDDDRDRDRDRDDDRDRDRDDDRDRDRDRDDDRDRDRDRDRDDDRDRDRDRDRADDRDREPTPVPVPTPVDPEPGVKVDPLPAELQLRLQMPIVLRVKVLVDDELISKRRDWIDYVQQTFKDASHIYAEQFGITLELSSVGRWPVATTGMDSLQLLDDLRTRQREEAHLLIGLTDRPQDEHSSGKADTPVDDNPHNGAYAIVYAKAGAKRPHLRTLLHEIGHTLGAKDVTDRTSPAYTNLSWMSYAPAGDDADAWIDEKNRTRILERKDLPFAPEPEGGDP